MTQDVNGLIQNLVNGNGRTQQELFDEYRARLTGLAKKRLGGMRLRDFDEEDVMLSVMRSFFRTVADEKAKSLETMEDIEKFLFHLVHCKVSHRVREAMTIKRGGGKVSGESFFGVGPGGEALGLDKLIGEESTSELACELAEELEKRLRQLPDELYRAVAICRMEGFTNKETAKKLGVSLRNVERRLERMREIWADAKPQKSV